MSRSYQQMVFMLFRERRKRIAGILLGACIDAVTVWLGCILIFSWLDYYLPFPYLLRITLRYGCIAGGIIFFLLRCVLRVLPFPLKRMSLLIQREMRRGDEIINAYQLGMQEDQPGISQGLKDVYIQNVAEGISSSPVPRTWLKPVVIQPVTRALMMGIIAGIMYIVPPSPLKLFFPRIYGVHVAGEIYRYLQIEPGDALVPEGMPVTVRVTAVKPLPAQFVLMVKGERTSWE